MLRNERGVLVLGATIVLALVCSITAYTLLIMSSSQALRARMIERNIRARYLAEAGRIWAAAHLWRDPMFCPVNLPVTLEGMTVLVSVTNCGLPDQQILTQTVF